MDQYAIVELTKEQVIEIIKNRLVQDENAQDHTDYDVIITYIEDNEDDDEDDEYDDEITTTIVKTTSIAGYKGSINEDIDEEDTVEILSDLFEDEDDYLYDSHEIICEDSPNDTGKKVFKGIRLRFDLRCSYNESFIKEL